MEYGFYGDASASTSALLNDDCIEQIVKNALILIVFILF